MLVKDVSGEEEFVAGDSTFLREILHPRKDGVDTDYSLAQARLRPGDTSYEHSLKSSEVYFILEGEGVVHVDDESEKVRKGQLVYIPPESRQYIENTGQGELVFLCVVSPPWKPEDEEVEGD